MDLFKKPGKFSVKLSHHLNTWSDFSIHQNQPFLHPSDAVLLIGRGGAQLESESGPETHRKVGSNWHTTWTEMLQHMPVSTSIYTVYI